MYKAIASDYRQNAPSDGACDPALVRFGGRPQGGGREPLQPPEYFP